MRLLFVVDKYYPKPLANAVCAQSLIDCFTASGVEVDVLAFRDGETEYQSDFHGAKIETIVPSLPFRLFYYGRLHEDSAKGALAHALGSAISKVTKAILLPWFPLNSFFFPLRLRKKIESLNSKRQYDGIVTVMAPFDAALAGYWCKKRNPEIRWVLYALDTIENMTVKGVPRHLLEGSFWLDKFISYSDLSILMRSRESWYRSRGYCEGGFTVQFSDIPLLACASEESCGEFDFGDGDEHWVYAGSFMPPHYRYEDIARVFLALPDNRKRVMHFFSGGAGYEQVRKDLEMHAGRIVCHDYVSHSVLRGVLRSADILVSMKYTDQISAKVFEYMSYGKPILHISGCPDDPNRAYVEKYSKGLVLSSDTETESAVGNVCNWLEFALDTNSSDAYDARETFKENTPEYTCEMIVNAVSQFHKDTSVYCEMDGYERVQ